MTKMIVFFLLGISLYAQGCELESFSVNWTAFKTPAKIGVSGTFERPKLKLANHKDDCLLSVLPMSTVHIQTASVKTDNAQMDNNIVNAFFKSMNKGEYIDAIIKRIDIAQKELSVEITMNDKTQTVFMNFNSEGKTFLAKGKIDLLNFSASQAINSLNEACFESHKGKTWSEVEISFMIQTKGLCQ